LTEFLEIGGVCFGEIVSEDRCREFRESDVISVQMLSNERMNSEEESNDASRHSLSTPMSRGDDIPGVGGGGVLVGE